MSPVSVKSEHRKILPSPDASPPLPSSPLASSRSAKTYRCRLCPEFVALTKNDLSDHQRQSHIDPEKLLKCPLESDCRFVTIYKHHLDYHVLNHSGQKPFHCPHNGCTYSCVNKSMLNSHLKCHSNVQHYGCQCGYRTKYLHSLKLHLSKNTDHSAVVPGTTRIKSSRRRSAPETEMVSVSGLAAIYGDEGVKEESEAGAALVAPLKRVVRRRSRAAYGTAGLVPVFRNVRKPGSTIATELDPSSGTTKKRRRSVKTQLEVATSPTYELMMDSEVANNTVWDLSTLCDTIDPGDELTRQPAKKRRYKRKPASGLTTADSIHAVDGSVLDLSNHVSSTSPIQTFRRQRKKRQSINLSMASEAENIPIGYSTRDCSEIGVPVSGLRRRRKGAPFKLDSAVRKRLQEEQLDEPLDSLFTVQPASPLEIFVASSQMECAKSPRTLEATTFSCPHCSVTFGNEMMYQMHMGFHSSHNPFHCFCGHIALDKVAFFLHIAQAPHF